MDYKSCKSKKKLNFVMSSFIIKKSVRLSTIALALVLLKIIHLCNTNNTVTTKFNDFFYLSSIYQRIII